MRKEAHVMPNRHMAHCDFCKSAKPCRSLIVVHGLSGFNEKKLCADCEAVGRHQDDIRDMRLSNAMKDDLDGYPDD